jgi:hypothetical protein
MSKKINSGRIKSVVGISIALLSNYATFCTNPARAQQPVGPILWRDPNINWTPGAQVQSYDSFSCPEHPNQVTISFSEDYDRQSNNVFPPILLPAEFATPLGTGGGLPREILFVSMGNPPSTNPGFGQRDRQTLINILFDSPVSLGNFFMADICSSQQ